MRYPPIVKGYPHFLHGGDYNPEQWKDTPGIWDEDFRLARLAGINTFSIGIFAWAALEPAEGKFEFGWLDAIMERMAQQGMKAVLATPSGAKPNWMARQYPEIRRVLPNGLREPQQGRHNHCFTSPVYREKVTLINTQLAQRYGRHPALGVWHLSNEYSGECHCALCKSAFRAWLQKKYGTLEKLNFAYWAAFWSHTYTAWEEIDAIDESVHGLVLDWKRFVSDQTTDFIRHESAPLRKFSQAPVTTNFMGTWFGLDYRRLAKALDVAAWDSYPAYHARADMASLGSYVSMIHDLIRGLKGGRPFMLMESSPSATNWFAINKLLKPGIHKLKSLQAVAHGADTVQYFQFRKSRGSGEKFHGAVVDHAGHEHTRVFREVAEVGALLKKLGPLVGAATPAETALVFDWENWWILEAANGPRKGVHLDFVRAHYRPFWRRGVPVDVIGADDDFRKYKLLVAPMLYMVRAGVAERIAKFVERGGTFVTSFLTGIADENDLCFLQGWPGPLKPVLGIWAEELDNLYDDESNRIVPVLDARGKNAAGLSGEYQATLVCDLVHAEGAAVLAAYGGDFYAGFPALTVNTFGKGRAYYLAARMDDRFLDDFLGGLSGRLKLRRALDAALPPGVTAQLRAPHPQPLPPVGGGAGERGKREFVFLLNFNGGTREVPLGAGAFTDLVGGGKVSGKVTLPAWGAAVLQRRC